MIGILFMLALVALIMYKVVSDSRVNIEESNLVSSEYTAMISDYESRIPALTDQLFMIVLVGLTLATLIGAFMIQSHPLFYWISMIALGIFAMVNAILANVWQEFAISDDFVSKASEFVIISHVMRYFPFVIIVISIIIAIVMYSKSS